jgi:hypothetical protein
MRGLPVVEEMTYLSCRSGLKRRERILVVCFLAHVILSLLPSSADTERLFSDGGFTLSERCQHSDAQRLDG